MSPRFRHVGQFCLIATTGLLAVLIADEVHNTGTDRGWKQHDIHRPKPPVVEASGGTSSSSIPKDAVVLVDGKSLDAWQSKSGGPAGWKVADGVMEVTPGAGAIQTKGKFGDIQLHVEWASPNPTNGTGQDRGNSGIFLMGKYEIQVLDSYRAETYADGQAGAIYGQYPPLFNASRRPGEWQTYDIAFRRPRFDKAGKLIDPARVTLIHNGILVQNNESLLGLTYWLKWSPYEAHEDAAPIELQDHGHPVKFRNMWLRNLPERPAPSAKDLKRPEAVAMSEHDLDRFLGQYVLGTKENAPKVTVTRGRTHLLMKFPFLPQPLVIEPVSPLVFALPQTDGEFRFQEDSQGRVTGATFRIGDGERSLMKLPR
ncbi:MAG: hypothetical protein JWN86_15 [Planctomycetota bacterium]|nr:hypothetical protein [Planctomycetota bacterium]